MTVAYVRAARSGRHYDGGGHGLILRVTPTGAKRWTWRGTVRGRAVELGLGSVRYVTLREARERAFEYRRLSVSGIDPRVKNRAGLSFGEALERVIEIQRRSWKKGSSTEAGWRQTARAYMPALLDRPVADVQASDVLAVVLPIWLEKHATADRVLRRVSTVLKWAVAEGLRDDDPCPPVRAALPRRTGLTRHHRAIPHAELGDALERVQSSRAAVGTKLAVRFLTLTAARTGEVRLARWGEISTEAAVWCIPGPRTKTGRDHRIPLSRQAIEVLERAGTLTGGEGLVFNGQRAGRPVADRTIGKLFRDLDLSGTPHGLRSSFRSWAAETDVRREVAEQALGHVVRNQVEAAYQRSDLLEQRREVMQAWADAVDPQ
ncbi:MAG: tyrosine-type recombinase/integrase [Acidobacteria bacterium]|nr:tyrosine-type recombinase/integrase [Acidobacteriota bacterium]